MLQPPVSTPTARSTAMPTSRICWYSRSVSVIAGATVTESPVCTPIASMFSIEQMTTTLSLRSRISSSSYSFQPSTDSSMRTVCTGESASPWRGHPAQHRLVGGDARAEAAHGEAGPDDDRVADLLGGGQRLLDGAADRRAGGVGADRADDVLEQLPVLAAVDRVDVGADQLDAVLLQHAVLVEADRDVERGLPAEGGQQRVGALLGDDLLDELRGQRLDVGGVGDLGVGHDRRRVAVDQADPQALRLEHPAGLGAGVVELARPGR